MQLEIYLDGTQKLLDTTRLLDYAIAHNIQQAVNTSARELRDQARSVVPEFTGNTARAIKFKPIPEELGAIVWVDRRIARHVWLLTHGRGPGKVPSVKDPRYAGLVLWAEQRGVNPRKLIASMAKKGTKAAIRPTFMIEALEALRAAIEARIHAALEAAFTKAA